MAPPAVVIVVALQAAAAGADVLPTHDADDCVRTLADAVLGVDPAMEVFQHADARIASSVHASERRWQPPELMGLVHGSVDPRNAGVMRVEAGVAQRIPRRARYDERQHAERAGALRVRAERDDYRLRTRRRVEELVARSTLREAQVELLAESAALLEDLRALLVADSAPRGDSSRQLIEFESAAEALRGLQMGLRADAAAFRAELVAWAGDAAGVDACRWVPDAAPAFPTGPAADRRHPAVRAERAESERWMREAAAVEAARAPEPVVTASLTLESMRFMGGMDDAIRPGVMVGLRFPLPAPRETVDGQVGALHGRARESEARASAASFALDRALRAEQERLGGVEARLAHLRDVRRPLLNELRAQLVAGVAWLDASHRDVVELARWEVALATEEVELMTERVDRLVAMRYLAAEVDSAGGAP